MQQPLAIAVIGGLTLSTAVTLLLLPRVLEVSGALRARRPEPGVPPGPGLLSTR